MSKDAFIYFVFILFCSGSVSGYSQTYHTDSTVVKELTSQIIRYKTAWMNDDVETSIDMTHPEMIGKMGGADRMRMSFQRGKELRAEYKMRYTGFDFIEPDSVLVTPESYQVAFPVDLTTTFDDGTTNSNHMVMIAYCDRVLTKWYFLPFHLERKGN